MDPLNIPAKFEVCSFTRSWDNRGYSKKFGPSLDTPTLPFLQNFSWACVQMYLWIYLPNLKSLALAVPEIIVIAVLGWVANPQSRGREGRRGSGMVPFERAIVTSYRPSIVTFPLYLRVSEILPLLCSCTPFFPTPPLVSPKFPNVPLGLGGYLWAMQLVSEISNLCNPDPPTSQTDRRTDRQTDDMQSQYCAMH